MTGATAAVSVLLLRWMATCGTTRDAGFQLQYAFLSFWFVCILMPNSAADVERERSNAAATTVMGRLAPIASVPTTRTVSSCE